MTEAEKAAENYCDKEQESAASCCDSCSQKWSDHTAKHAEKAFLAGAAWQREQDAKICDWHAKSGTRTGSDWAAAVIREQSSDERKACNNCGHLMYGVCTACFEEEHEKAKKESQNDNACEDWCHCRKCGGFKPGGKPYGHSCSCSQQECKVKESGK